MDAGFPKTINRKIRASADEIDFPARRHDRHDEARQHIQQDHAEDQEEGRGREAWM